MKPGHTGSVPSGDFEGGLSPRKGQTGHTGDNRKNGYVPTVCPQSEGHRDTPFPLSIEGKGSVPEGLVPDPLEVEREMMRPKYRTTAKRAVFWQAHAARCRAVWADAGMSPDQIDALMDRHRQEVKQAHADALPSRRRVRKYRPKPPRPHIVHFDAPPPAGTEILIGGKRAVVISVEPYVRKTDGADSHLILWDIEGRRATSGLRTSTINWVKGDSDAR